MKAFLKYMIIASTLLGHLAFADGSDEVDFVSEDDGEVAATADCRCDDEDFQDLVEFYESKSGKSYKGGKKRTNPLLDEDGGGESDYATNDQFEMGVNFNGGLSDMIGGLLQAFIGGGQNNQHPNGPNMIPMPGRPRGPHMIPMGPNGNPNAPNIISMGPVNGGNSSIYNGDFHQFYNNQLGYQNTSFNVGNNNNWNFNNGNSWQGGGNSWQGGGSGQFWSGNAPAFAPYDGGVGSTIYNGNPAPPIIYDPMNTQQI